MKLKDLIALESEKNNLDWRLLASVVWQESRGEVNASRYEHGFYKRYLEGKPLTNFVPKTISRDTERRMRAFSFGLCQIMGQVARERGLKGDYIHIDLCNPEINIALGARILSRHIERNGNDVYKGLLRYNGGGNPRYPNEVLDHMKNQTYLRLFK